MFLKNGLCRGAARALKLGGYPVLIIIIIIMMSARVCTNHSAFKDEITLISQDTNEARGKSESSVKERSTGSPESQLPEKDSLSEQDRRIHHLHQDACAVSESSISPWLRCKHSGVLFWINSSLRLDALRHQHAPNVDEWPVCKTRRQFINSPSALLGTPANLHSICLTGLHCFG